MDRPVFRIQPTCEMPDWKDWDLYIGERLEAELGWYDSSFEMVKSGELSVGWHFHLTYENARCDGHLPVGATFEEALQAVTELWCKHNQGLLSG